MTFSLEWRQYQHLAAEKKRYLQKQEVYLPLSYLQDGHIKIANIFHYEFESPSKFC